MEVKLFNCAKEKFGTINLESSAWSSSFSPILISLYNRYNLLNKRNVISKTKNKSEVSGGGRKPWRRKGTGRARQGSIRSPQWRGGGVVFGPTGNQNYSIEMNKKEKKKALSSIISKKLSLDEMIVVEEFEFDSYNTRKAVSFIKNVGAFDKNVLFVTSSSEDKNNKLKKSFDNIKKVSLKNSKKVDVYDILCSKIVIFSKNSLPEFESRISK